MRDYTDVLGPNAGIGKASKYAVHERRKLKRKGFTHSLTMLKIGEKSPNMSRRVQRAELCAFPSFDRCDSLVFLPVSMSRLINSADTAGLRKLLLKHVQKRCVFNFKGIQMTLEPYLQIHEFLNQANPDQVSCVHDTKVMDNTIRASLFTKYTENKMIYETAAPLIKHQFPTIFSNLSRKERWAKKLSTSRIPEPQWHSVHELVDSPVDLVVYANMEWVLTFHPDTRKITFMDFEFCLVSVKNGTLGGHGGLEVLANAANI